MTYVTDSVAQQGYHECVINGGNAMVTSQEVQRQLHAIGVEFHLWGRAEVRELTRILVPGEQISHCVKGHYEGGFAVLCATDRRLLLIDKKPFYLTLEDVRYDMISEVDFNHRLMDATVRICTVNKTLHFTSMRSGSLRSLTAHLQDKVMESRHQPVQVLQPVQAQTPALAPADATGVAQYQYQVANPFTKVPLMVKRRVSRFYPLA